MKLSVIFGFVHMMFGLIMKLLNCIHFKAWVDLCCEWLPQFLFMISFVGYMDFLIILKWVTPDNGNNKPSLITLIIDMFFFKPPTEVMFPGQEITQVVLVIIIFVCIPWMLIPKPIFILLDHKKAVKRAEKAKHEHTGSKVDRVIESLGPDGGSVELDALPADPKGKDHHDEEEWDYQEVCIIQMIETIEFSLGTVSNTASYLRLWALSLAHMQLSHVILSYSLLIPLNMSGNVAVQAVGLFICVPIFAAMTFGIMLCMEALECFLHSLRLQWVEFQNKFFKADGYPFSPFRFKQALSTEMEVTK
eukprot:Selendium_serpulae@DN5490_c0_g1_i2.p1